MRLLTLIGAFFALLLFLDSAQALSPTSLQNSWTTYYTATNGNDSNPGTEASPFRTLAKGVSVLRPGDTLLVKEGLYEEQLNNTIPSGESWDRPVTVRAYPNHTVTIRPTSGPQRVITFSRDRQFIVIDGFILDGANVTIETIKVAGNADPNRLSPSHIRIINNEIRNSAGANTNLTYRPYGSGILVANSNYVEIINNIIHHNGKTDFDHGIYHRGSYGLIEGNTIYRNTGSGIKVGWDSSSIGNIVRNNLVYDNNASLSPNSAERQGRGIGVYSSTGTLVYNNLVLGRHFIGIDVTYGGDDARIYNNTVSISAGSGIIIGHGSSSTATARNAIVSNNIVYQQSDHAAIVNRRGANTTIENNLTFGVNAAIRQEAGTAVIRNNLENVDPQFANPSTGDYNINAASPAIDAGLAIEEVLFDYEHVARPQGNGYDIGAYEFLVETNLGPTMQIDTTPWLAAPGEQVNVLLSLINVADLYGIQAECSVDPLVLAGVSLGESDIFNSGNSLLVDQGYSASGHWIFAASRMSPHPAVSGNGAAFNLQYQVQSTGSSLIDCSAIAVDRNGRELPLAVMGGSYNMSRPPAGQTETPVFLTPTPVSTPTSSTGDLEPTPASLSTINGLVAYQSQADNTGIRIQLLQESAIINEIVTSVDGSYFFVDLPLGSYRVLAAAPQHLTFIRNVQLESSGQAVDLGKATLIAGDVDDNGVIDIVDAGLIGANFGVESPLFPNGDLNRDRVVNIADLVLVGSNFGLTGPILGQ